MAEKKTVAEMAAEYYRDKLWKIDRLRALVANGNKLTETEYEQITGEKY